MSATFTGTKRLMMKSLGDGDAIQSIIYMTSLISEPVTASLGRRCVQPGLTRLTSSAEYWELHAPMLYEE